MHHLQPFSRLAFCSGLSLAMLMPAPAVDAQPAGWTPPRTADGRIDLNGVWANNAATPLERPDSLAGKAAFSDEEVAQLRVAAERLFGGGDDAAFADGVFNAVLADVEKNVSGDGGTGNYSSVWMVDREFENRTSLITDPPDGKVPALTPEAEARIEAVRVYREAHPADGPEDRTRQVRCVTYGIPRVGGLGAGYNSYYQIFSNSRPSRHARRDDSRRTRDSDRGHATRGRRHPAVAWRLPWPLGR